MQVVLRAREMQIPRVFLAKQFFVLVLLFVAALGVRLYHINEPPLNFHATRQYRSLLIARGFYFETAPAIPEWQKEVAQINRQSQGILEPPLMEYLVSRLYRLTGGEAFWIPRLLSALFWLGGGVFLYLIALRLAGTDAALFSTAFYLLLPFSVVASRSFQPDPLMILLLLAGVWMVLRYYDRPSSRRLAAAAAVSALACFVKPVSLFVLVSVFLSLAVWKGGVHGSVLNRHVFTFLAITLLPTLAFYLYGIFVAGFLRQQAQASFLPGLWLEPFFWRGWLGNMRAVVGYTALIAGLAGVLLFPHGRPRVTMIGLWMGYAFFCLVFNYHIATHDYYHLQLVPVVALSLGPGASLIWRQLREQNQEWYWRMALWFVLLLALLASIGMAAIRLSADASNRAIRSAEEIGEQVGHSTRTILLSGDYGLPLQYHGELAGLPWPLTSDLEWERLAGVPVLGAEERFRFWFAQDSPEYFVVQDLRELEQQVDLQRFLMENFSAISQNERYIIFDLRQR